MTAENFAVAATLLAMTIIFSLSMDSCAQKTKDAEYMNASKHICEKYNKCADLMERLKND